MRLLVKRALDRAAFWHRDQKRKYPGAVVPYVSHPAGVALRLARHGFDDEVVAAGALHDVVEDCGVTREELAGLFGRRIAELVIAVSEPDKSLPWDERKRQQVEHLRHIPWEAQAIKLSDKIDNFESIAVCAQEHGDPWGMFKRGREDQLAHFDAFAQVVRTLPPHALVEEYFQALAALRTLPLAAPRSIP